ncbi:hypothetical protein C8Q78DRAFT_999687 [Trametes maxima]|nr:hypothetical protein C8Q78DRAFT_999687 [Trametes maxima]
MPKTPTISTLPSDPTRRRRILGTWAVYFASYVQTTHHIDVALDLVRLIALWSNWVGLYAL